MYHVHKQDVRKGYGIDTDQPSPPPSDEKPTRRSIAHNHTHNPHQNGISSGAVQQQELHAPTNHVHAKRNHGKDNVAFVMDQHNGGVETAVVVSQPVAATVGHSIVREMSELHQLDRCKL